MQHSCDHDKPKISTSTAKSSHQLKEHNMSFPDVSVPAYLQILGSLSAILTKAEAHCAAKNIQPDVLLGARLNPDMLPLTTQIETFCDFAAKGCAPLTQGEVPSPPATEKSFAELQQRLANTIAHVKTYKP